MSPPDGTSFSGGARLNARLAAIAKKLGGRPVVRVGFLENATYPDGSGVAAVAAMNEFGTATAPPRPFFRRMIAAKKDEWGPATALALKATNYDAKAALGRVGMGIAGQLRQAIVDFTDPPLAPSTIARKSRGSVGNLHGVLGPAKPLVDTGLMLASIDMEIGEG